MKKIVTEKTLKVYKVTFGEFFKGEEYYNAESFTVLGETAELAIVEAKTRLSEAKNKICYVESVEFITEID